MKNVLLASTLALLSAPALAKEYNCHSINNDISARMVFDDGPGGIDIAEIKAFGHDYALKISDEFLQVIKLVDRDTYNGTFEYGRDQVEIGFSAKDGMKFDIFVKRGVESGLIGTFDSKARGMARASIAITCSEGG